MKERLNYFDSFRAIAIIAVIFIHTNNIGYKNEEFSLQYNLSLILRQISNFGVPLFLAISGYFMMNKKLDTFKSYWQFLKKSIPRVFIPFFVWSLFYSLISYGQGNSISLIIKKFIMFGASVPFYFILLIIQYYLLQPCIRKLGQTSIGLISSLIISITSCLIIEYCRYYLNINIPLIVYAGNFLSWIFFPTLGSYLYFNVNFKVNPKILFSTTLIFLFISCLHAFYLTENYKNVGDAVTAVKVSSFLYSGSFILYLFSIKNNFGTNQVILKIGVLSFGIYFSHMLFLNCISIAIKYFDMVSYNILMQILITFFVLLCSYYLGKLLRKINQGTAIKYFGY